MYLRLSEKIKTTSPFRITRGGQYLPTITHTMLLHIRNGDVKGIEKEFKRVIKPDREYEAILRETKLSKNIRKKTTK